MIFSTHIHYLSYEYCHQLKVFQIFRLIGSIPGPIIFGFIIDRSCVLESGNCLVYDNKNMSIYMMSVTLVAKCLGLIFIILTLISSKWCKIKDEEDVNR